jgi:hypothetical protein
MIRQGIRPHRIPGSRSSFGSSSLVRATLAALPAGLLAVAFAAPAVAQDANYILPPARIEARLRDGEMTIIDFRGSRMATDRTQRMTVQFPDSVVMVVKLAKAPYGGATFNNEPRYELAAYVVQTMFLDPADYCVPPTVVRSLPVSFLKPHDPNVSPTFDKTNSVVAVLQYWLLGVTPENFYDKNRAKQDTTYARYLGNFNVLTYLIRHSDSNQGNFLISQSPTMSRIFSVDNGVAFESQVSDRGFEWRNMRVDRIAAQTVDRLRAITPEMLQEKLGVLVQFGIRDGVLVAEPPGANMDDGRGVRHSDTTVQFGLTSREIKGVQDRLRHLLEDVDKGKLKVF